jgi:1-acyl-sn-glycerol-3-phosphate acyltransferase
MGMHNIEKWSLNYILLWTASKFWHNFGFYRKVVVLNRKKIPKNQHLIYAPIHQNALMDALGPLYHMKKQPVFLARSDIFRKPFVARILYSLKILPIFRIRDGRSALKNNDKTFLKTIDVIKNKNGLAILPEGQHEGKRRLKPLKKGIARIAFQAEEAFDFSLNIKIIPVGIDYGHYVNFRSTLVITFGDPIEVSQFYDLYKENAARGMNKLLEVLSEKLRELMIDIRNLEHYEVIDSLREIYHYKISALLSHKPGKQPQKFFADQKMVNILNEVSEQSPEILEELKPKVSEFLRGTGALNLRSWIFSKENYSLFLLILKSLVQLVLFPVYIWGLIHNYIPYKIPQLLIRPIKDIMFHSSFKFVISFLTFQIFYLIIFILLLIFVQPWWLILAYIFSLPLTGLFAFHYYIHVKKTIALWRFTFMSIGKNKKLLELKKIYDELISAVDKLIIPKIKS